MTRKWLWTLGILAIGAAVSGNQRWLATGEQNPTTDGVVTEFPLPNPGSGPTTIALTQDGTVWFTESAGTRIGRRRPDGTGLTEFPLPNPNSSPRIIAVGSDGNLWFSEHTGNRMGRITPAGVITEYPIPTPNAFPRAIALGADGNICKWKVKSSTTTTAIILRPSGETSTAVFEERPEGWRMVSFLATK